MTTFDNEGTLLRSAGNGAARFASTFSNNGLVDVQTGGLSVHIGTVNADPAQDRSSSGTFLGTTAPPWSSAAAT